MKEIAITTENLTRDFGNVRAVDNLSIEIPRGIVVNIGFLIVAMLRFQRARLILD